MFWDDKSILPCDYRGSPFVDKVHNLTMTSSIKIINKNKLHKLFSEGTKYIGNITANYWKAEDGIITGLKPCIQSWCGKHVVPHH